MIATVLIGISTGFIFLVNLSFFSNDLSDVFYALNPKTRFYASLWLMFFLPTGYLLHESNADLETAQVCLLLVSGGSANVQNIIESAAGPLLAIFYQATGSKAGSICLLMYVFVFAHRP